MAAIWHQDSIEGGVLRVRIDQHGKSVNAFSRAALDELAELLAGIRRDPTIRGVLFRSGKPGTFIVGADVNELKDLRGRDAAREISQYGQGVFQQLAELPVPTVALISGACLGGGLEFAMSCTYRIAADDRKTLLALPEVMIGLVPGWGGTVRLPRLVGLKSALPMILTGEMLNGRQARSKGLVHDVVPTEALDHVGGEIVRRHLAAAHEQLAGKTPRPIFTIRKRPLLERLAEATGIGRKFMIGVAEKQIEAKAHGHYPAPICAIRAIRAGMLGSAAAGFATESEVIGELAENAVTTELMRLFFIREDAKNPPSDLELPIQPDSIKNAAVLGAGQMGTGIARLMAERGIWVRLKDVKPEFVARGIDALRKTFSGEVRRRRMTPRQAEDAMDHISPTTDYRGLQHADVVIEAVVEEMDVKRQVFRELAAATSPNTVLATNTSSLLVAEIAEGVPHPERVVGLHFFNPPHQMKLVEVVRTHQTSPEALATALALVQRIGKTPIVVRDCAGFLVNRLLTPYMNEVGYLLTEVADPMEIERAAIAFGFPMGPMELIDLVGIGVAAHVAANMHRAYGPRMEPAALWGRLAELRRDPNAPAPKFIERTWRGKRRVNPAITRLLAKIRKEQGGGRAHYTQQELIQRLVYPVINEAARCLEEGIVERPEHLDLAMVFGTGFAPFRGGPLRYADSIGLDTIVETLDRLAPQHPRLAPCDELRRRVAERKGFCQAIVELPSAAVA